MVTPDKISSKELEGNLEKGKFYIKRIAFVGILIYFAYTLLATLNILPRYSTMYGKKRGNILNFILAIDPLKNFGAWLIISLVTLAVIWVFFYYFSKKKQSVVSFKSRFIFDLLSFILFYGIIFFVANIIVISILKIFGII